MPPARRGGRWQPEAAEPRFGVVRREEGGRSGRREGAREEAPGMEEPRRRRFVRAGQWEEAAPSKADRKRWEAGSAERDEQARRSKPREEAPAPVGGSRGRRFVVRPPEQAEREREPETPGAPWRPEPQQFAEGDPLAAFMADAPPLAAPPGLDRLRALAAQSRRKGAERSHGEAPQSPRERPSREPREKRPARKAASGRKKATREAAPGKRKGTRPPKSGGGKFKPGRRKR
jgi:ribonuclease R